MFVAYVKWQFVNFKDFSRYPFLLPQLASDVLQNVPFCSGERVLQGHALLAVATPSPRQLYLASSHPLPSLLLIQKVRFVGENCIFMVFFCESDQFRFLRDTSLVNLKGSVVLIFVRILTKASFTWISIPLDLSSRSFTGTTTSVYPFSSFYSSFSPFPRTFSSEICLSGTWWVFILTLHQVVSSTHHSLSVTLFPSALDLSTWDSDSNASTPDSRRKVYMKIYQLILCVWVVRVVSFELRRTSVTNRTRKTKTKTRLN
jgi:hypothetical protein